jgi:hypothetical protein
MGDALLCVRNEAPDDVATTIDWLTGSGFAVHRELGPRCETFGDLLVDLTRPPTTVRITRERGQWGLAVAADDVHFDGLHVLLTARGEFVPAHRDRPVGEVLPETLPEAVKWHVAVPIVLAWLETGERGSEVEAAREYWRSRITTRLERGN